MFCSSKKRSSEALERYSQALAFYRDIGDRVRVACPEGSAAPPEHRLGEANTLKAIGDVLQFQKT